MVSTRNRDQRIAESRAKLLPPCELDETLCLYSPQDNVDALRHPRVRQWLDFIETRYVPALPDGERSILLLLPCTKTKPYPLSTEHLRINQALLNAGFRPVTGATLAEGFAGFLPAGFSKDTLALAPLRNQAGVVVHRAVVSEPLAFVPYEHVMVFEGQPSPACIYDDPGLFEGRGNAVSPWRADFTGVSVSDTRWLWGDEERRAYVFMHNAMAEILARVLSRLASHYDERFAWVAPGLTHRSFILGRTERRANKVVGFRQVGNERQTLVGANDRLDASQSVTCLPTPEQCRNAQARLARRLGCSEAQAGAIYARGGGGATPLALPELLEVLVATLSAKGQRIPGADLFSSPAVTAGE